MKYLLSSLLILMSFYGLAETVRLSEPVDSDASSETFGELISFNFKPITLDQLMAKDIASTDKEVLVETTINKVCQKKGCFFIAQAGDEVVRVSFKNYGFFIPTDAGRKTVLMLGNLVQKDVSPQKAEHFNQDLNLEDNKLKAGKAYEFIASAIKIPK